MANDQPPPTPEPIQMGAAADGSPVWFAPHSELCAQFAKRTSAYLTEMYALSAAACELASTASPTPPVGPLARHDPRQPLHAKRLAQQRAERQAERQAQLLQMAARLAALRAEVNAHVGAAALACRACAAALSPQAWPLPGSEDLLSEVLRAEVRERHAAQR